MPGIDPMNTNTEFDPPPLPIPTPGKPAQPKTRTIGEVRRAEAAEMAEMAEAGRRLEPYPDPERPDIVRVPIASRKHEGLEALVDAEALPLVRGKRWNWSPGRTEGFSSGSVVRCGVLTPLARIVLGLGDPGPRTACRAFQSPRGSAPARPLDRACTARACRWAAGETARR